MYFKDMMTKHDNNGGILWFGMDTMNVSNSRPGIWERRGRGTTATYGRDRHIMMETTALELLFR